MNHLLLCSKTPTALYIHLDKCPVGEPATVSMTFCSAADLIVLKASQGEPPVTFSKERTDTKPHFIPIIKPPLEEMYN